MENNINAVIIATEITKGMKSIGPKSLLQLRKTLSVIEYQILELKKNYKNIKITVATGFESDKMEKAIDSYGVNIIYNSDFKTTNQVKSIIDYINLSDIDNLLIIHSGVLFKNPFKGLSTKTDSAIYVLDKNKIDFNIGCQELVDTNYLFYDLPQKWSECVFFNEEAIEKIKSISKSKNMNQLYTFELINILIEDGQKFNKISIPKNSIMKIVNIKDLNKAKVFI